MGAPWDAAARKRYKEYIQLLVALVLGAIVLLPTLVGLSKPPMTWPWAVPLSVILMAASVGCLGVALVACVLEWSGPPFILMGIGFFTGLPGRLLLLVYTILNAFGDLGPKPNIMAIKASPIAVAPGKYVELDVETSDKGGEKLSYRWSFENRTFSQLRNGYLKAPSTPGVYPVSVEVANSHASAESTVTIEVTPTAAESTNNSTTSPADESTGTSAVSTQKEPHGNTDDRPNSPNRHQHRARAPCPG